MVEIAICYRFNLQLSGDAQLTVPELEDVLYEVICQYLPDAEMVGVRKYDEEYAPDLSPFPDESNVFIEFIIETDASVLKAFISDGDPIADHLIPTLTRDNLYLDYQWNDHHRRCFVMRLLDISGKMIV